MNNQIQLVLKSSTTELSLNNHELGIYLVPELDGFTGLPEIRTTSGVNAGYDGGWTSAQNYDARSITIRGVIANENVATVEQLRRQLTTLAGQGKNEELTLDLVTQAGKAYTVQARTIALEMSLQKVLTQQEFMLQLRADDPLIYDGGTSGESVIVQVQKAIGGFQIDFELPLAISGGSGESTINNGGLEQVYPIIKMYGALHNPTFVNQTTNQQFQVNATLGFADGAWHTPSELYKGTTINIQDAPDNAPLASFQLDGETSQNGTPTPDAPVPVQTVTGENVVKICGKNILNTDNTVGEQTQGGVTASMSGSVISIDGEGTGADGSTSGMNRTWALTTQIPLAAGTYSISGTLLSGSWTAAAQSRLRSIRINLSSGTYKEVSASNGSTALAGNTFTLTEATNVVSVQIMVYGQVKFYDAEFGLQLELGSTATAYEPYQSQSYPISLGSIELCKIGDYQDYIYKDGTDWKIHKEVGHTIKDINILGMAANNNTGTTIVSGNGAFVLASWDWGSDYASTAGRMLMSANIGVYKYDSSLTANAGAQTMADGTFCQRQGTNDRIYFRNTAAIGKTGDQMKAILLQNGGGSDAWYPLDTPTDTEITNEALVGQLDALLNTARTYAGINNIFTITPNEQGTLEISYMTEKDADKRDVMVIDSRMRTVTLNGADIYHLITSGSEFPMLAPGENKLLLRSDTPGDNGYADVNYKQGYLTI